MSYPADGDSVDVPPDEELTPAEAFSLLGNDTRLEILQALWELGGDEPVAFSELYDRVDIDDSAHFNYHLKQLTEHFVRKTDAGYTFRTPGWKVVRAVFAGTFTERTTMNPVPAPGDCYDCGGPLEAWYAEEHLTIACADCRAVHVNYAFPPGGLDDREPAELLQAFHHHVRHHYCLAADGVCPECMGRVETSLSTETDYPGLDVEVTHKCVRCRNALHSSVGLNLLDDAEVLTFHADRGVDLSTRPFWTLDWCVSDAHTTVECGDSVRVRLDIPCEGDVLTVRLDGSLDVLERSRAVAPDA